MRLDASQCLACHHEDRDESIWPPPPRKRRAPATAQRRRKRRGPPPVAEVSSAAVPPLPPAEGAESGEEEAMDDIGVEDTQPADAADFETIAPSDEESEAEQVDLQAMLGFLENHLRQQGGDEVNMADAEALEPDLDGDEDLAEAQSAHAPSRDEAPIADAPGSEAAAPAPPSPAHSIRPPSVPGARREPDVYQLVGMRMLADVTLELPGGRITFYRQGLFTATCTSGHGRCVMTRSAVGGRRPCQGRPLGVFGQVAGARHVLGIKGRALVSCDLARPRSPFPEKTGAPGCAWCHRAFVYGASFATG